MLRVRGNCVVVPSNSILPIVTPNELAIDHEDVPIDESAINSGIYVSHADSGLKNTAELYQVQDGNIGANSLRQLVCAEDWEGGPVLVLFRSFSTFVETIE